MKEVTKRTTRGKKTISIDALDREAFAFIRQRFGLSSDESVIHFAVREMYYSIKRQGDNSGK